MTRKSHRNTSRLHPSVSGADFTVSNGPGEIIKLTESGLGTIRRISCGVSRVG